MTRAALLALLLALAVLLLGAPAALAQDEGSAPAPAAAAAAAGGEDEAVTVPEGAGEESVQDESSSEAGSEESSSSSDSDDGKVTIVENSNHLRALAEKKLYDQETEAKMHEARLKRHQEEHEKKQAAFDREQRAEQSDKSEQALKAKTKLVEERNEKQRQRESSAKAGLEAKAKRVAESGAKDLARRRQAATQKEQEARAKGGAEGRAKAAAHRRRKAQLKAHHKKKSLGTAVSLRGHWRNYGGSYAPATVSKWWRLCTVEGLVKGSNGLMAQLPANCRPSQGRLIFNMHRSGEHRLDVLPDGRVYRITGHGGYTWTSLAGITFDTARHHGLWLHWGWRSYGHGYRPVTQTVGHGLCVVSGLIRSGRWNYFGRVTGGCYPRSRLIFSGNNHHHVTRVDVRHDGYIFRSGGYHNHHWVSLDGLVWANSGNRALSLRNGWHHYGSGYRGAHYSRRGNLCVLTGLIRGHWSHHIATLPAGCRPGRRLIFGANVHNHDARVDVLPDGRVLYINRRSRYNWISLSGIRFVARR